MAEELADVQNAENAEVQSGVVGNEPLGNEPSKPEKLTIRQSLEKSVAEVKAKEDQKGRLHGKDGKFTTVEAKDAPVKESPKTEKDAQPKTSEVIGPPPGWSAESKAVFATLPDHIKNDLVKREKEVSDGFKKYSDDNKRYQEIEQVLAPIRQSYQQAGVPNDAEAIKRLVSWEQSFRNPATRMQAFNNLASQYGINLNSPQSQTPDPLRPVLDQFGQISQTVNNLQSELQRSREEKASEQIAAFSKDKPHFEKVKVRMGQLIMAGLATDLDGAYQQATNADPEIRALLIKEQVEKQIAENQKNQQQRSQAARQASISPSTRAPNGPVMNGKSSGKRSVGESLRASIKELQDNRA